MIVIADDITGAAEIAGIAFSQGQQVRLICSSSGSDDVCSACGDGITKGETVVIATDTRSMTEVEAVTETQRIASALSHLPSAIFKKTDSALRGHVIAELSTLMRATGYQRAVYLPANPSKSRIIRNGIYYIKEVKDVPISETAFSYDPEFPAKTSVLKERFPEAAPKHIIMPDATCTEDIHQAIAQYNDGHTIFAGAADLFTEVLMEIGDSSNTSNPSHTSYTSESRISRTVSSTLILCGSTQSKPLDLGIPIAPMPTALYDGSDDISLWDTDVYADKKSLILTIPHQHRTGKAIAIHLRTLMSQKTKALVAIHRPEHLIIEGGATAWAVLQTLGWTEFEIVQQISPGVVNMKAANGTLVTLKPGSYSWGPLFNKA